MNKAIPITDPEELERLEDYYKLKEKYFFGSVIILVFLILTGPPLSIFVAEGFLYEYLMADNLIDYAKSVGMVSLILIPIWYFLYAINFFKLKRDWKEQNKVVLEGKIKDIKRKKQEDEDFYYLIIETKSNSYTIPVTRNDFTQISIGSTVRFHLSHYRKFCLKTESIIQASVENEGVVNQTITTRDFKLRRNNLLVDTNDSILNILLLAAIITLTPIGAGYSIKMLFESNFDSDYLILLILCLGLFFFFSYVVFKAFQEVYVMGMVVSNSKIEIVKTSYLTYNQPLSYSYNIDNNLFYALEEIDVNRVRRKRITLYYYDDEIRDYKILERLMYGWSKEQIMEMIVTLEKVGIPRITF